jgi:phosphoglycerate kinase
MAINTLQKIRSLGGKRVLVRVDFNVPMKHGQIVDDSRLRAAVLTIQYLVKQKAKVILISHLGRPDGKKVKSLTLRPIAEHLENLLAHNVSFVPEVVGVKVEKMIADMLPGDILLLENVRFVRAEQESNVTFAKQLAKLADVFVLDGFAVAHRADSSVFGVAKYLPTYAGFLLETEIAHLTKLMKKPKKPFTLILGGVKTETKIPVIKKLLPYANHILLGGAIASTYFSACGYGVGESMVDDQAKKQMSVWAKNKKIIAPVDVIVGTKNGKKFRPVTIPAKKSQICKKGEAIFDIGPATIQLYATYIKKSKTVVWNGAMGYFEQKPYHHGTLAVARLVASRARGQAYGVIGGGETITAMNMVNMAEYVDFVSTGGGAMLEFLSGAKLPGVIAVQNRLW